MLGGNVLAQARFEAKFDCADEASNEFDAYLNASVGLRLVCGWAFHLNVFHGFPFFEYLCHTVLKRYNGSFVVCFQDHFCMSKPFDVRNGDLGAIMILVVTFLWDDVCEDVLSLKASDQKALEDFSGCSCLRNGLVAC